jgi:hypothetical protein
MAANDTDSTKTPELAPEVQAQLAAASDTIEARDAEIAGARRLRHRRQAEA